MPIDEASTQIPPAQELRVAERFDLGDLGKRGVEWSAIRPRCAPGGPGEIVVCAPDPEKERLRPLPDTQAQLEGLPRARWDLGKGLVADVYTEAAMLPGGAVSNRVMIGVKTKF